jgi:hypothetical protein
MEITILTASDAKTKINGVAKYKQAPGDKVITGYVRLLGKQVTFVEDNRLSKVSLMKLPGLPVTTGWFTRVAYIFCLT